MQRNSKNPTLFNPKKNAKKDLITEMNWILERAKELGLERAKPMR